MFWTELSGTVMVWQNGAAKAFAAVSPSTSGERGLLGLALSPGFAQDHYVYAFYSRGDDTTLQRVVRWTDCGGSASAFTVIIDNLPAGTSPNHKGGRIAFSPDGHLFVTLGDNAVPSAAQNSCDIRGKVLRYTASGAPAGNGCSPVWTSGLRNPFGIAFAPDGTMAITNNGPSGDANTPCGSCGDIFDLVGSGPGVNYEWATCWGYSHRIDPNVPCSGKGPDFSTENSGLFVAPTGVTYANGQWLFCAYSKPMVFAYYGFHDVRATNIGGCGLDVKQAPDGVIYTASTSAITRH
jgi:glucose/arabinose dehydrogenase